MGRGQRQAAAPLPPCSRGCIHYPCLGANRDAPSCLFTLSFCKPRAHLLRVKVAQPEAEEEAGFAGHSGPPDGYPPRGEGGGASSQLPAPLSPPEAEAPGLIGLPSPLQGSLGLAADAGGSRRQSWRGKEIHTNERQAGFTERISTGALVPAKWSLCSWR